MTPIRGPLARLERSRDELAKAWLVRLIERASLDEISELPTEQIARELPELISDIVGLGRQHQRRSVRADRGADRARRRAGRAAQRPRDERRRAGARHRRAPGRAGARAARGAEPRASPSASPTPSSGWPRRPARSRPPRSRSSCARARASSSRRPTPIPLTGLDNLRYLQRELAHMLEIQKRYGHPFAVLLMDIDGLKRVNDAHGHQAGDRVLMQVAMALRRSIRSVDMAARLGGDEFCVLAPSRRPTAAAQLGERLAAAVGEEVASRRPARGHVDRRGLLPRARRRTPESADRRSPTGRCTAPRRPATRGAGRAGHGRRGGRRVHNGSP